MVSLELGKNTLLLPFVFALASSMDTIEKRPLEDSSVKPSSYTPGKNSFLRYMDILHESNATLLSRECASRRYDYAVYYRVVLFLFCNESKSIKRDPWTSGDFQRFCRELDGRGPAEAKKRTGVAESLAKRYAIYENGLTSDERDLAKKSCAYIRDYNRTKEVENYTEWFVQSVPFALPVTCGFSYTTYKALQPAFKDCLPPTATGALYFTFVLDSIILFLVVASNLLILLVILTTPSMRTIHGYYRNSLACADLLIGCSIAGSMRTNYKMYLVTHAFLEEGERFSLHHYHTSEYTKVFGFFTVLSIAASVFTLAAISVERFVTNYQLKRTTLKTKRNVCAGIASIIVLWTVAVVIAIVPIFLGKCPYKITSLGVIIAPKFYIVYVAFLGLSLLVVWVLNSAMCCCCAPKAEDRSECATRSELDNNNLSENSEISSVSLDFVSRSKCAKPTTSGAGVAKPPAITSSADARHERVLIKTARVVVIAFTVAILPSIGVMLSGISLTLEPTSAEFSPVDKTVWNSFAYLASRILFANSFANAIIYNYMNEDFRRRARQLLRIKRFAPCCRSRSASVA